MERINTVFKDLPPAVRGLTVCYYDPNEGLEYFTIFINATLSNEARSKAFRHELQHIIKGDFGNALDVDMVERIRHEEV